MLRTEIIDVPKEAIKCDWDDEDNLENELEYTPPEAAGVTRQCNPRNNEEFYFSIFTQNESAK